MVKTYGLTHVAVAVRDVARSKFYRSVFGAVEVYAHDGFVQLQTPGRAMCWCSSRSGSSRARPAASGISDSACRTRRTSTPRRARSKKAGGAIKEKGAFVPGEPYLFASDPDGNEIEIWFERPTPVDPPARRK